MPPRAPPPSMLSHPRTPPLWDRGDSRSLFARTTACAGRDPQDSKAIILPVAGNIAASYNFCNIGYAVQLMRLEHPVPRWAAPAFASSCLCGAVVGQLLLGWFGDRFGRRPGMVIAMGLIVFGALGSAIMTTGYGDWIWQCLVAWRFILGIGLGGTYPLTAVIAGEMNDERGLGRTRRVALSIAVQIVGNILAPVLMLVVLILLGSDRVTEEPWATELGWRFLLGIGALPGIVALRSSHARASGSLMPCEQVSFSF